MSRLQLMESFKVAISYKVAKSTFTEPTNEKNYFPQKT